MNAGTHEKAIDLESVVAEYWPQINFRVKRSLGYSNPDWEDVCADILISVIESLKKNRFREESSLSTYIYAITSHKISDYYRLKCKKLKHAPLSPNQPDPFEFVEKKEQSRIMLECIRKLKPKHADILYLYYYQGFTQSGIISFMPGFIIFGFFNVGFASRIFCQLLGES